MEFINITESSSIFSFKYSSPRCLSMHSWYKYNYQTSHPPPSVRSSYQPPFLLQLPWIAWSQDSCQYRDQMTVWLTKLNSWHVQICLIRKHSDQFGDLQAWPAVTQQVPHTCYPGLKQPEQEAGHSPTSSTKAKNPQSCISPSWFGGQACRHFLK